MNKKTAFWIIGAIVILLIYWVSSWVSISSNPRYSVGVTTDISFPKSFRKETKYYFYVDSVKYDGFYTEYAENTKEIKVPDGKYLVVYSANNPEISILLIDKPIIGNINIDSLNKIRVDPSDIDWTNL